MKVLGVIIARGGSKGIPNKNLALINGRPLISYSIQTMLDALSEYESQLIVSTDSINIKDVAVANGAWCPFLRPAHLAEDHVQSYPVVQHAVEKAEKIKKMQYDTIAYMQPTSPLCRPQDIKKCLRTLMDESNINSAVAITQVSCHPFRMKRLLENGQVINYIDQGFEDMRPRQTLPKVYRRAGSIYVSRRKVIMEENTLVGEPCKGIDVPSETAIDIDTPLDLELVRQLLSY